MANKRKCPYTDEELWEAVKRNKGNVLKTSVEMGISERPFYDMFERHPEWKALRRPHDNHAKDVFCYQEEQIINALIEGHGLIKVAAEKLGMSREALRNRIRYSDTLKKAFNEIKQHNLDQAESKLWNAIEDEREWAISLYLKSIGKERGYGEMVTTVNMNIESEVDLSKLSMEELENLNALITKVTNTETNPEGD